MPSSRSATPTPRPPSARSSPAAGPPPAATDDQPLAAAEFARLIEALGPFESRPRLAVAVSGGPDSMALALLAAGWAAERGGGVLALTVDHGLRAESAAEAATAMGWLARHGIPCRLCRWEGTKPRSGIQAAARDARYRLLAAACAEAGILHLATAQHRDDQAETLALRAGRGSGPAGLAAMPAIRELERVRLLRPLLGIAGSRLLATLRALGQPWLDDPSNRSPAFARSRLRAVLGPGERAGLAAAAAGHGRQRAAADRRLAGRLAAAGLAAHPLGFVRLAAEDLGADLGPVLDRVLRAVSGRPLPPRRERLARLVARLGEGEGDLDATLHGCLLRRRHGRLTVLREPAAAAGTSSLAPGERRLWDGRFTVRLDRAPGPLRLGRLGAAGRRDLAPLWRSRADRALLPAAAIESLPGLWREERLLGCPCLGGLEPGIDAAAWWTPAEGLAGAPFAGANIV